LNPESPTNFTGTLLSPSGGLVKYVRDEKKAGCLFTAGQSGEHSRLPIAPPEKEEPP
jgi:hypothetical protein